MKVGPMPEVDQYVLNHKELLALIIKASNCHEGRWMLMANFGIAPGNYGPSNDEMVPGVAIAVTKIGIKRAEPNTPVEMTLDAAVVNPAPKRAKAKKAPRPKTD